MPRRLASVINTISTIPSEHAMVREALELRDRDDRRDAGRDRHRDGEDVVDEQRRAGDQRRVLAEVLAAHDVAAAAARVGEDRLAVRERDDREQDRDRDRDRDQRVEPEREARRAERGDEEDLLGRVRRRRDRVGGEDRERDGLRDALVLLLGRRQRPTDQEPFDNGHQAGSCSPRWMWYGTDTTTTSFRKSRRPLSISALWLCSRCSHQWLTTNSGITIVTTSLS